jgi:UDP-hydrolysing UDP-N-acetyl-D-glucosamine 2-epimerase
MLLASDTGVGVAKATGLGIIGIADALSDLRPDIVVLLGDRFETLAAAVAGLQTGFPIAHIHGGELSQGSIDDAMRHAITKMAALHFVAAAPYRDRVIAMGEPPERVFLVGGMGVDAILATDFAGRAEIEARLGMSLGARNLLVTFHPATADAAAGRHCEELLAALAARADTHLVFTMANTDAGGREINAHLRDFVARHGTRSVLVASLGSRLYLSCMRLVDGIIGNSSSGLLEAPSLAVGTVNIGDRQEGRLSAASVIDCAPERRSILAAIERLYDPDFRARLAGVRNPYGDGGATARVLRILKEVALGDLTRKKFHDRPAAAPATHGSEG